MDKNQISKIALNKESTEIPISKLIETVIESLDDYCKVHNLKLIYNPVEANDHTLVNQEQFTQVLKNLLFIAGRFIDKKGEIFIEQGLIKGKRHNDITDFFRISIRATGLNVSNNLRELIIERSLFFRDTNEMNVRETPALQFNEAIEKIKGLGGNFWVKSLPTNGLNLNFTIPLIKIVNNSNQREAISESGIVQVINNHSKPKDN